MSHLIKHYIEDQKLIPMLLEFGWIVRDNTWTDCPHDTQKLFQEWHESAYKTMPEILSGD